MSYEIVLKILLNDSYGCWFVSLKNVNMVILKVMIFIFRFDLLSGVLRYYYIFNNIYYSMKIDFSQRLWFAKLLFFNPYY
jgi:hypothetical protein